jgi:hypothetical protein
MDIQPILDTINEMFKSEGSTIVTVIITIISVLGSTGAWKYYEKKAVIKQKETNDIKDDFHQRIDKLEILLEKSSTEKDELRTEILRLVEEVSKLRVKVVYLEKENNELKRKNK